MPPGVQMSKNRVRWPRGLLKVCGTLPLTKAVPPAVTSTRWSRTITSSRPSTTRKVSSNPGCTCSGGPAKWDGAEYSQTSWLGVATLTIRRLPPASSTSPPSGALMACPIATVLIGPPSSVLFMGTILRARGRKGKRRSLVAAKGPGCRGGRLQVDGRGDATSESTPGAIRGAQLHARGAATPPHPTSAARTDPPTRGTGRHTPRATGLPTGRAHASRADPLRPGAAPPDQRRACDYRDPGRRRRADQAYHRLHCPAHATAGSSGRRAV